MPHEMEEGNINMNTAHSDQQKNHTRASVLVIPLLRYIDHLHGFITVPKAFVFPTSSSLGF